MTTTKKNYVKPTITVIDVEPQQMICASGIEYSRNKADEIDYYTGEFD